VSDAVRHEVHYSGRVQGVGFRYTARGIAGRFRVSGYVENMPDGRVRLVAEGAQDDVGHFLEAVRIAMAENIRGVEAVERPATGEFDGFEIRH
jgi:acylphosphatase